MSDEMTIYDGVWDETMAEENIREVSEGNLIKKGKWPGQLLSDSVISTVTTEKGDHPFEGQKLARCHVLLYTDEGEKHLFFDASPRVVKITSKSGGTFIAEASRNGAFLYQATKMAGMPFHQVLKYAAENMLTYDVGVRKATEDYPARNTLRGISAYKGE